MRRRPLTLLTVTLALVLVSTAACGTRSDRASEGSAAAPAPAAAGDSTGAPAAEASGGDGTGAAGAATGTGGGSAAATGSAAGASGSSAATGGATGSGASTGAGSPGSARGTAASGATPGTAGGGTSGGNRTQAGSSGTGGASAGPAAGGRGGATDGTPGSNAATPGAPGPVGAAPAPPRGSTPVLLASIGTYSGPAAATLVPYLQGTQIWIKAINGRAGLNGHPVNLIVYDDGGDPARYKAQLQDAVERRHALALMQLSVPLTGHVGVDYLKEKRIPVVGLAGGESWGYSSPYLFPQMPVGDALSYTFVASMAEQNVPQGRTKLGMMYCAEAQGCSDTNRLVNQVAKPLGFEFVYQAKVSLAQPDFTAECLAARNAGVQVLFMFSDSNSTNRIAASCVRQSFHPQFAIGHGIALDRHAEDPNLDGMISSTTVFPYFQTGTPAADEFHSAVKSSGKAGNIGVAMAQGWTSGKLMEKAGVALPEPPTTEAILQGLWRIKDDTLGGITLPLTFTEGQNPTPVSCWFDIAIRKGAWVSVDNFKQHCR